MGNALFEPILQCISRYTATRLVIIDIIIIIIAMTYPDVDMRSNVALAFEHFRRRVRWRATPRSQLFARSEIVAETEVYTSSDHILPTCRQKLGKPSATRSANYRPTQPFILSRSI